MAKNEFGVESSDSGGFGAGAGSDFDFMFEEANNRSVVDDEISESRSGRRRAADTSYSFDSQPEVEPERPVVQESPAVSFEEEDEPSFGTPVGFDETDQGFEEIGGSFDEANSGFGPTGNLDEMFSEAENASVVDDEVSAPAAPEPVASFEDSFENFGAEPQQEEQESFQTGFDSDPEPQDSWVDPAIAFDEPEIPAESEPEPVRESVAATPAEPVYYEPAVGEPTPSLVPEAVERAEEPRPVSVNPSGTEADVDYIERVILTSDAIRELPEADAKAVNMFITAGQPVESHQELVLTALLADRQILKTSKAILEAKSKESVDRAFHILGLDETTFVDFGKILSHDLETTETVLFEGDRLRYARKLVDVVEALPAVSIKRFEAVQSVLGAGELNS